jgi:hypothetical protein
MPRPLCFTIMPYGRKPTQAEAGYGPQDRCYVPVIKALGYQPIRADQDTGALIITQMLERPYFADLVLADMTVANRNVYYEVGIRHAMKEKGCVLLAADWSRQLFDVAQMRTVRYPLPEGMITEQTAQAFASAVKDAIPRCAAGASPVYESIRGYPSNVGEQAASTMKDQMTQVAIFQAESPTKRVQFDVFLCYNKQDKVAVRRLNETLKDAGITTWLDEEQIKPGDIWQRKLEEIISSVPAVLVIVGDSKIGPFQDVEEMSIITEFVRRGCKVIPVFIGSPSQTIPGLPLMLKPFMWSDLRGDDGHQVAEIISTLRTPDGA